MPRKPRFIHPLRVIRTAIGKSQPQFGAFVGCSAIAIRRIENGGLKISFKLASRIQVQTGVLAAELMKGKGGKAVTINGQPYTKEFFDYWREHWFTSTKENADRVSEFSRDCVTVLLQASARPNVGKLSGVFLSIGNFLNDLMKEYKLESSVDAVLKERIKKESHTMTWGEWRKESQEYKTYWGFKDDKKKPANESKTFTHDVWPGWSPWGSMKA